MSRIDHLAGLSADAMEEIWDWNDAHSAVSETRGAIRKTKADIGRLQKKLAKDQELLATQVAYVAERRPVIRSIRAKQYQQTLRARRDQIAENPDDDDDDDSAMVFEFPEVRLQNHAEPAFSVRVVSGGNASVVVSGNRVAGA